MSFKEKAKEDIIEEITSHLSEVECRAKDNLSYFMEVLWAITKVKIIKDDGVIIEYIYFL